MEDLLNQNVTEEIVERSQLTGASNGYAEYTIEDLRSMDVIVTPTDVPLLKMLLERQDGTEVSKALEFTWVETALSSNFAGGKYNGYDVTTIDESTLAGVPKTNYIMAYGQIARVGGMVEETETVGGSALSRELKTKYAQLCRGIEYYLFNGDHSVNLDETNGINALITLGLDNGGGALLETVLMAGITLACDKGIMPDKLLCAYNTATTISSFAQDRVRYTNTVEAQGGIGMQSFMYNSPFGYGIEVVPVRSAFIPSGKVFIVQSDLIKLRHLGAELVKVKPLAESNDGIAMLLKAYFGLEVQNADSHVVISNVRNTIT